nr:hypothetical protein [Mycoplasmopsis bovis]
MKNRYQNQWCNTGITIETVILDDSKSNEYIEKVNEFANKHNLKVVRREIQRRF